jgi:hypothetical protein
MKYIISVIGLDGKRQLIKNTIVDANDIVKLNDRSHVLL